MWLSHLLLALLQGSSVTRNHGLEGVNLAQGESWVWVRQGAHSEVRLGRARCAALTCRAMRGTLSYHGGSPLPPEGHACGAWRALQ